MSGKPLLGTAVFIFTDYLLLFADKIKFTEYRRFPHNEHKLESSRLGDLRENILALLNQNHAGKLFLICAFRKPIFSHFQLFILLS